MLRASALASSMTRLALGVMAGGSPVRLPSPRPTSSSTMRRMASRLAPYSWRMRAAVPPSRIRPRRRCSGPIMEWPKRLPSSLA
jgi:hypothetical protein